MSNQIVSIPTTTLEAFGGDEFRSRVWYEKYAMRGPDGNQVETLPSEMWSRVATEIASVEKDDKKLVWTDKFYWLLKDFKFIPGGRILFGAGQSRNSTLLNCFYIPIKEDSIEGIFDWCKEAARTYSYGGGVGADISILRPKGSPVNNSAIQSTGSVSFMELMSTTTGTIGQAGRRGALLISLRVDHPDIEDFISIKKDLKKVNYANISVRITDAFMDAVEKDEEFNLHFKNERVEVSRNVKARDIWNKIVKAAWESDEPCLVFWDTIKRGSTTEYNGMEVTGQNPCTEETLEDYGNCCLGSVNLSAFVDEPFTSLAHINFDQLVTAFRYGVRFLDNVLDYNSSKQPLPQEREASLRGRRIGIGFTGLGDMLIKLGLKYDDERTVEYVDKLFEQLKIVVYDASITLATEKGSFPAFDAEKHLNQPFIQALPQAIKNRIKLLGLRNVAILTVPPVGSGSILAGTSSGVEPVFEFYYKRRSKSLTQNEYMVVHPLMKEYEAFLGYQPTVLPSYFVTAHDIKGDMRVKIQATIQKHIDTAISSTVNLPEDTTVENVNNILSLAWKYGCKGISIYREGSREGMLETNNLKKPSEECPECKQTTMVVDNGCHLCKTCGYSRCEL